MDKDQGELLVDANEWLKEVLGKLSCPDVRELTISKCKVPNKELLATWLLYVRMVQALYSVDIMMY